MSYSALNNGAVFTIRTHNLTKLLIPMQICNTSPFYLRLAKLISIFIIIAQGQACNTAEYMNNVIAL